MHSSARKYGELPARRASPPTLPLKERGVRPQGAERITGWRITGRIRRSRKRRTPATSPAIPLVPSTCRSCSRSSTRSRRAGSSTSVRDRAWSPRCCWIRGQQHESLASTRRPPCSVSQRTALGRTAIESGWLRATLRRWIESTRPGVRRSDRRPVAASSRGGAVSRCGSVDIRPPGAGRLVLHHRSPGHSLKDAVFRLP
jgi:hypothetical protein